MVQHLGKYFVFTTIGYNCCRFQLQVPLCLSSPRSGKCWKSWALWRARREPLRCLGLVEKYVTSLRSCCRLSQHRSGFQKHFCHLLAPKLQGWKSHHDTEMHAGDWVCVVSGGEPSWGCRVTKECVENALRSYSSHTKETRRQCPQICPQHKNLHDTANYKP